MEDRLNENLQLKSQCEQKKREEYERRRNIERNEQQIAAQKRKQEEIRQKLEADLTLQRQREEDGNVHFI